MSGDSQLLQRFTKCPLSDLTLLTMEIWLGRAPVVSDITIENRNRYLLDMVDNEAPFARIKRCQCGFRRLWRSAFFQRATDIPPQDRMFHDTFVVKPGKPWTDAQFARLIDARKIERNASTYLENGVHRGYFWEAFLRLTQETRLHRTMVQSIRWDHLNVETRTIDMTGDPEIGMRFPISEAAIMAIEEIRFPVRETILEYPGQQSAINAAYLRLLNAANVDYRPGEQHKQTRRKCEEVAQ